MKKHETIGITDAYAEYFTATSPRQGDSGRGGASQSGCLFVPLAARDQLPVDWPNRTEFTRYLGTQLGLALDE